MERIHPTVVTSVIGYTSREWDGAKSQDSLATERRHRIDFADDLSPELQCCGCLTPAIIGQIGPNGDGAVHWLLLSRRIFRRLASMVVGPRQG
jgi:hypothetical protein